MILVAAYDLHNPGRVHSKSATGGHHQHSRGSVWLVDAPMQGSGHGARR